MRAFNWFSQILDITQITCWQEQFESLAAAWLRYAQLCSSVAKCAAVKTILDPLACTPSH